MNRPTADWRNGRSECGVGSRPGGTTIDSIHQNPVSPGQPRRAQVDRGIRLVVFSASARRPADFCPVLNRDYAIQIARDWNVKESGAGFVTEFEVDSEYIKRFGTQVVGGPQHEELWVPADQLEQFNAHIVGPIRVIDRFGPAD